MAYSIWLEFDEASTSLLRNEISTLSVELGGPKFEPHMTLIGDIDLPVEAVVLLAEKFARCTLPSKLNIERVSTAQKYFMAIYLSVRIPKEFMSIRKRLSQEVNSNGSPLDEAHVSLAYGNYAHDANRKVISRLEKKFIGTNFDVRCLNIVQSSKRTPISEWKTIDTVEFS